MSNNLKYNIEPTNVHKTIGSYMLADGFPLVFDLQKSHGSYCHDSLTGREYLDMFTFFASSPIGYNHPKMTTPEMIRFLGEVAVNNITNSDLYTTEMASFVETFFQLAVPKGFKHAFFVAGGALGIENAFKASFDWKVKSNFKKGHRHEVGHRIISFEHAFHGRTGYTMSVTRTEPVKYQYYPMFDWPKVISPALKFPLSDKNLADTQKREKLALAQVKQAFLDYPDDIAAIIIEPIQAEGGDRHFRSEFLKSLKEIADEEEAMLIFDCVQTGMGLTGRMWAHEHLDVQPDMFTFGKKTQVCGFVSGDKIESIEDNVFEVSSRLNSTWGGNVIDMVRCAKYLEIIHEERLVENAGAMGKVLLKGLEGLQGELPEIVSNARGLGLMCAFDLPTSAERDQFRGKVYDNGVAILGCGDRSIRFRSPLNVKEEELGQAIDAIRMTLKKMY
ncbi:L-lysine 6-transaminase [candidate division LCP-89 bacterium B3_LCP]|uniref:L-lysine-epsilon aminotransferase n=1 Tax=candidate division LCP-89 bacterium B3_LCP TaxID=2012998 RepID=A0A532V211_UNCL8|nr:MAG: L-lysine 6-transaminase [candidate division LCP-89 bacterium B3_LCP]